VSVEGLLTKPVVLTYRVSGGKDDYGQPVWTETVVDAVGYYRLMSTDDADAVSREQIDYKVYLPVGTDMAGLVSVGFDGETYEVQGPLHEQWNPRTSRSEYVLASVRKAA
jgi:hypothetical protein